MTGLFAAAPHEVVPAGTVVALGAAVLPLVCWVLRRVRRGRWSFVAGSRSWRSAVVLMLVCGVVAGVSAATVMLVVDAKQFVGRATGHADLAAHDDVMVALQRSVGLNLAWWPSVDRWPDALLPSARVDVLAGGDAHVVGDCEVRYDDARADRTAGRDVSEVVDDPLLTAEEKASVYRLWCAGTPVEARDALRGVPLETGRGAGGWSTRYLLTVYAVGLLGGVAVPGFVIYLMYSIGPRQSRDPQWFQLVHGADGSARHRLQVEALRAQRAVMAADPQERRRFEAAADRTTRDMRRVMSLVGGLARTRALRSGAGAAGFLAIDPAIVDGDDRLLAQHLRATGRDPDDLFVKPRDPLVRGLLLAMLSLPALLLAVWLASTVDDPWEVDYTEVTTARHADAFVEHYTAAGFTVHLDDDRTGASPEHFYRRADLRRDGARCVGDVVSGFALARCVDDVSTTWW